ncbi:9944_t:CDS:2, partial [Rhizophagus irregularis]
VESTEVKLTENSDNELSSNVMKALIMLEIASLSLRSAYIRADSSLWSFVNLRSSVTNEAKVYSIQILPIATTLIRHLQEFSETYDAISFDEFKEDVHVLAKKAEENYKLSKYVSELHKAVYAEFKKLEDQANIVLNDLQMETRRYEAELRPPPIIASEQKAIIAQEIAINEEKKLAVAGAKAIKVTLVESINEFINAIGILGVVTQFFEILHQELLTFSNKYEKFKEDQAKIHFILIKKKAATLKWLSKMKAEINGENLSFLEWGKKWFRSNKEIANLLGLPSNNDR